jgi:hypothetical protein
MEVLESGPTTLLPSTPPCLTVSVRPVISNDAVADDTVDFESFNVALYQEWIELYVATLLGGRS